MMVLITLACGEGSDTPVCTNELARAFASRINKVCKMKKTPTFRHLVFLDTPEEAIIRGFYGYAIRQNLMFVGPFL